MDREPPQIAALLHTVSGGREAMMGRSFAHKYHKEWRVCDMQMTWQSLCTI